MTAAEAYIKGQQDMRARCINVCEGHQLGQALHCEWVAAEQSRQDALELKHLSCIPLEEAP